MKKQLAPNDKLSALLSDTIAAQATPPGRGGVAIVRVSGPHVQAVMHSIIGKKLPPRQASYVPFLAQDNQIIDQGIAIYFPNPHSFTGEDVLELQGHGGPVVVDMLLQRVIELGCRIAKPGEFSERAFLNDKLDLAQAEAIADLINASSVQAAKSALRSLQGEFSQSIHCLCEKIIYLRTYIEAAIDFTDEEIDFLNDANIETSLADITTGLQAIQTKAVQGSFLREGITAIIMGKPNVGKSSLLNFLSGKETAIVTDIPGTTRDVIRDYILIDGMPMHIIDTAGLRESDDIVEQEGIKRAYQEMERADLVLYVMDAADLNFELPIIANDTTKKIIIRNKIDQTHGVPSCSDEHDNLVISLSAKTGVGIDLLKDAIKSLVGFNGSMEGLYLARRRHLEALNRAASHLNAAIDELNTAKAGELIAEELRLAHLALAEITGEFTADDLLGRIFSSFCIGK